MKNSRTGSIYLLVLTTATFTIWSAVPTAAAPQRTADRIRLVSREFVPRPGIDPAFKAVAPSQRHGLIQFQRIPTESERNALRSLGGELFTYIPDRAFLVRLPADVRPVLRLPFVRYVGPLQPNDKIEPRILKQGVNPFARNQDGTLKLSLLFFPDVPMDEAAAAVTARGGRVVETVKDFHLIRADVPEKSLRELLAEDKVQWVDDVFENQVLNDQARALMGVDQVQAAPYSLDGTGLVIGDWDGGHAIDSSNVVFHQDLVGRVTNGDNTLGPNDYHATHVAGTAIGSGLLSATQGGTPFQWKGMAPGATLIAYDWNSFLNEYAGAILTHHINLSTNSWHNGGNGFYTMNASTLDTIVTGYYGKRIPILWAAGNQRRDDTTHLSLCENDLDNNMSTLFDSYDCVVHLASAKNTITVGAINSNDDSMTDFSSWGPTNDGRLKPEIVAPGCQVGGDNSVTSTVPVPVGSYTGSCGTSMAAPAAAGATAILLQRFKQLCPSSGDPLPSTVKALLIHGARDLDDGTAWDT
ncbi:MAG TPA: S8 family serine peptidase, partial [Chthoniobacterales bacterium]